MLFFICSQDLADAGLVITRSGKRWSSISRKNIPSLTDLLPRCELTECGSVTKTDLNIYRRAVFEEFDRDHDEKLSLDEVAELFAKLSKKVTSYPAVSVSRGLFIVALVANYTL